MSNVVLSKHEGKRFESQTVYVSGNAYLGCTFENCTMVLTNPPGVLSHCTFKLCHWHLNFVLLAMDIQGRNFLRALLDQMDDSGDQPGSPN